VSTLSTSLITNNLSVYTTVYKFQEVPTLLIANDLSVYINDIEELIRFLLSIHDVREVENVKIKESSDDNHNQANKNQKACSNDQQSFIFWFHSIS
jgi:hypothetical protein